VRVLASIPSPSSGEVHIGGIALHAYGVMLLLGILAAVALTGARWTRRGGDWDLVYRVAMWGVAGGVVGARLYHVVTSWDEVPDPKWQGVFEIWKGGLGVWGGIGLGVIAGYVIARRAGADTALLADCLAPGLLVAQGIGRFGNWWNQELFGKPTDLPWGLEIDPENRPLRYLDDPTFHPTFLYEALWNFAAAGALILIGRRFRIRPPGLFALYVTAYCFGRFWIELLRVDTAHEFAGLRLNGWVAALGFVLGIVWFVVSQRGGLRRRRAPEPGKGAPAMAVPKSRVRPGR
jgi:phosphatidylglycerol---prolipoprotein diacylglyceryl transferase